MTVGGMGFIPERLLMMMMMMIPYYGTGYRSLEWNWPKEAMNRPIGAGIVDGAKLF